MTRALPRSQTQRSERRTASERSAQFLSRPNALPHSRDRVPSNGPRQPHPCAPPCSPFTLPAAAGWPGGSPPSTAVGAGRPGGRGQPQRPPRVRPQPSDDAMYSGAAPAQPARQQPTGRHHERPEPFHQGHGVRHTRPSRRRPSSGEHVGAGESAALRIGSLTTTCTACTNTNSTTSGGRQPHVRIVLISRWLVWTPGLPSVGCLYQSALRFTRHQRLRRILHGAGRGRG
jgi:hypothetical protein